MADTIKKNIFDPKTTFSSWSVFIALLSVLGGVMFWINGLQIRMSTVELGLKANTESLAQLPALIEEKLENNNNKLILILDDRYEKKK